VKVVILAGGLGTRLSEYTEAVPKPMVRIGNKPMLWHIMQRYAKFGHKEFIVALGYKSEVIKDFFLNYKILNSDFTVDLSDGSIKSENTNSVDWKVTLVETGINTMTGGRVRQLRKQIGNQTFMLTYGDGIADIDVEALLAFHKSHGKLVTMSAVRPGARFGELALDGDSVASFQEKPQLHDGWINGGFFVVEPEFLDMIDGDETMLERAPLEKAAGLDQLMAYRHEGFWQCMDTKRDVEALESMWAQGAPWL
jgi:glucose-1-phosphate cytidylyltransferase